MHATRRHVSDEVEGLQEIPLFADCSTTELRRIARLGTRIDVLAGRVLTREGSGRRECFVTLAGTAMAERGGRVIGVIGPGSIIGEMALLDGTIRNATVVAETPMRLLTLDAREFTQLVATAPGVAARLRRTADERRVRE